MGRTMAEKKIRMAAATLHPKYHGFLFYLYISYCLCLPSSLERTLTSVTSGAPAPAPATSGSPRRLPVEEVEALNVIARKLKITNWPQLQPKALNHCDVLQKWNFYNTTASTPTLRNFTCGNCDKSNTCHVTYILLKTQNLVGVLPTEFAHLKSLLLIDLTQNYINGSIPPEWGSLPHLTNISMIANRMSGSIPEEIGNISTLQELVLDNNLFSGSIPSTFGNLKNLRRLSLSGNDFTGELPNSLGTLRNMMRFRIDGTGISGKIPDFFGNWTNLVTLYMQGTNMEGPFPLSFSNLLNLSELQVSDLKGDGSFPPLESMQNLKYIILRNCSISGELPSYIGNMKSLKAIDVSFNNFTGEIPSSFINLNLTLDLMFLSDNKFTGQIPSWLLSNKNRIDISYNNFAESSEPNHCDQLGNLNVIASRSSSTNSLIKPCLRKNYPCSEIAKNYNIFINCGGGVVNFGGNQYEEDTLENCPSTYFISESNKWAFSSTGDSPAVGKPAYTTKNNSILKMNDLEIYKTARLSPSSLKYYGLCLINGNYKVNLYFAEIMLRDDQTYYSAGRRFFDVSIQGKRVLENFNIAEEAKGIGKEIIKSFNADVDGNTLEIGFRWGGKGTNAIPVKGVYGPLISAISITPNFSPILEKKAGLSFGAIISIASGLSFGILLIILILWFLRRKYYPNNSDGLIFQPSNFSFRQIKDATRNFDPFNKIGEGGFGPVFKGVLPDGTLIAVKKLSSKSRQGNQEFINEIGIISTSHHPNLVKLLGWCVDRDEMFLVYEYMENNSLAYIMFGPGEGTLELDWKTRRTICLGIARGLAFLHEESRLKIVHRDIKAQNVLLDKELNAKISDFGLAKLYDVDKTHITTGAAGTRGYMAPEYATRGHLTNKVDVYSFGIVMLEIVSGKKCIIHTPTYESLYLLDLAIELEESGKLLELVDGNLYSKYSEEEAIQMIKLALLCANNSPTMRPAMSKVVNILESKEIVFIPSANLGRSKSEDIRLKNFLELSESDNHSVHSRSKDKSSPANASNVISDPSMSSIVDSFMNDCPR